jgi:ubiquinone/menaquinone biosynthesis C-methylase UbiE
MTVDVLHRVFKTLTDPTRLRILALLEGEELAVQDLVQALGIAQSTVSRHLAILKDAGLIRDRRSATFTFYSYEPAEDGEWADAWRMARRALRNDPTAARDARALQALLRARTVRNQSWFDRIAPEWDSLREVFQDSLQRARAITRLLPQRMKVCEIGTGTGVLATELAHAGVDVIAVDHAPRMLEAARAKLAESGVDNVEFRLGDATALPLADGEVDAAMAHMVLHYLPRPLDAICEMVRVVRPGGRVVLVDFDRHELEWMRRDLGVYWQGFERDQIRDWLEKAGLEDVVIESQPDAEVAKDLPLTFIACGRRSPAERPATDESRSASAADAGSEALTG